MRSFLKDEHGIIHLLNIFSLLYRVRLSNKSYIHVHMGIHHDICPAMAVARDRNKTTINFIKDQENKLTSVCSVQYNPKTTGMHTDSWRAILQSTHTHTIRMV